MGEAHRQRICIGTDTSNNQYMYQMLLRPFQTLLFHRHSLKRDNFIEIVQVFYLE